MLSMLGCGSQPMYGPCESGDKCGGEADGCFRLRFTRSDGSEGDGNLCTRRCGSDADCPGMGACLALAGDPDANFICLETCSGDETCFEGQSCTLVSGASVDRACLP